MEDLVSELIELKKLGAIGVKISYEDEGALTNEVMTMRSLTHKAGLNLNLKIGGCEAKRDILEAIDLQVDGIVAPMIESGFALKKFLDATEKYNMEGIELGINVETITGYHALDTMKDSFEKLDFVTFGRVDFASSCDKGREYVDTSDMQDKIERVFTEARKKSTLCCLGGAMSTESADLVSHLRKCNLLDKIETRYIIFDMSNVNIMNFGRMMYLSNNFELKWMKYIKSRYGSYESKDNKRIDMIKERVVDNKFYTLNR